MNVFNILVFIFSAGVIGYIVYFYRKKGFENKSLYGIPFMVLFASLIFSGLAFLNYKFNFSQKENIASSNIVFVLDVSKSMLVGDYQGKSRLEGAKNFIKNYILNNPNNRYSLTIFSGDVSSVIPLTSDKKLFLDFLETIDERSLLNGGTNFYEALQESLFRYDGENHGGAIILLSDFETTLDKNENKTLLHKISLLKKDFQQKDIQFIAVGIGSEQGGKIPESYDVFGNILYKRNEVGNVIISFFDNDFFQGMIQNLDGISYKIDDREDGEKNISFRIPSEMIEIENSKNDFIARYFLIISYFFFLGFLYLYVYFEKKGK